MNLSAQFAQTLAQGSWVEDHEIPEPYRGLLCHHRDMTSTLANFHQGRVTLEVLRSEQVDECYYREVTLWVDRKKVEFGLIKFFLENLPHPLRTEVLAGKKPFGEILNESGLSYSSKPIGFFHSGEKESPYGRHNCLLNSEGKDLAHIVEILPHLE